MVKLLTAREMRELDRATIEEYGLPGMVLMEHAGLAVARAAADRLGGAGRACILCGKGNNGGDGFVAARWLARWGHRVEVFLLGDADTLSGDARTNYVLCRRLEVPLRSIEELPVLRDCLRGTELIIDALLGTGVTGPPRGALGEVVRGINDSQQPVLAVDLPTGVNADTGEAYEPHVRATWTITFGAWKRGLATGAGAVAAGRVELADIGLPEALLAALATPVRTAAADVAGIVPARRPDAHKGDAGRVVVVAGSRGYGGAAALAARAAVRGGAGLVTLAVPQALAGLVEGQTPEAMTRLLPDQDGALGPNSLPALESLLAAANAVAVGPGIGTASPAGEFLDALVTAATCPLVLDADALNLVSARPGRLAGSRAPLVLTPHPGEAARLLGSEVESIQKDRYAAAAALAERYQAVVLLKGFGTVVAAPDGRLSVNSSGTPAMASGGMGDALTGVVAALLGQGIEPFDAVRAAAWLHGCAAQLAAAGADAGLLASDLIEALPHARAELRTATEQRRGAPGA